MNRKEYDDQPGSEPSLAEQVQALEIEVSQLRHTITEAGQSGGHDGSTSFNAAEMLVDMKAILIHYNVYDSMVDVLPAPHKLKQLSIIKSAVVEFSKKYQLTLSPHPPQTDYDLFKDAAASVSNSEWAAQDLELDQYQEIDKLNFQLRALKSDLVTGQVGGKLSSSEATSTLQFVKKIDAALKNTAGLPLVERIDELKLLITMTQGFVDTLRSMSKIPIIRPTSHEAQIFEAERTFVNNYLIVKEKLEELKIKLTSYSDIDKLTQSNKIEGMRLLVSQLLYCENAVEEFYREKGTLSLEVVLDYIKELRKVVDDAIKAIKDFPG